jgi:adenylate cyclase
VLSWYGVLIDIDDRRKAEETQLSQRALDYIVVRYEDLLHLDIRQAMLLSPRDPSMPMWNNLFADAELGLGRYDAAIESCKNAIDGGYRVYLPYLDLAAAHALKDGDADARTALDEARRLNPRISIRWLTEHKPYLEPAFDSLRKAGLPEE